ncbi:lipopolysaccharide biosynthesis protein [Vagococcus bubulae]|uniref:Uncharacterized protein n=2 Tax=Vagococcus bubulae TaxID=1977868 RepID=A0A429ZIQ1_9ENTE|nr:polysaccharide biosynthesis C-terminal domain-containing protein [Vagococcus bubulae]RST93571.1 hypothetical protein CBF36_07030 [Vagococcus bubulae]
MLATLFDISWFYYGIEDFKIISLINFIIKIISFLCILFFIKNTDDLWLYFLIQSISILISNISLWLFLKKYIRWIRPSIKKSLKHFKPALKYFIGKISISLYTNLNKTLLGILVSSIAVGLYSSSLQLITIFVTLIGTMDTVLMPHMTKLFSNNNYKKMIQTMEKTIDLQFFMSVPLMFGILAINRQMIPWFFGSDFMLLNKTVPIFSPLVIIMPLGISIVRQYLIPRNRIREFNISVIISAIISVLLNILLLPVLGIYGSIISTLIAECVVTLIRLVDLKKHTDFQFNVRNIIFYFLCSLIMYFIVLFFTKHMPSEIFTTILQGILGIFVYFILTAIFKVNVVIKLKNKEW